jgi:hypothetical protein
LLTVFPPRNYAAYLEIQPWHSGQKQKQGCRTDTDTVL